MNVSLPIIVALLLAGSPEWQTISPKDAGFSVSVRGQPNEKRETIKAAKGNIDIRFFSLTAIEGTYVAGLTRHPESVVTAGQDQSRLDQARDGAVKLAKGRISGEKTMTVEGRAAREFFILATETGHAVKVRLIADRNRLYQLMVVGNTRFLDSPEAVRFMDSFRLTK